MILKLSYLGPEALAGLLADVFAEFDYERVRVVLNMALAKLGGAIVVTP
jgi:hypothetical protein